jgi:hypothetical protein
LAAPLSLQAQSTNGVLRDVFTGNAAGSIPGMQGLPNYRVCRRCSSRR